MLLDNDRAVGNFTLAAMRQPLGNLRRVVDVHRGMDDGCGALDEWAGVAHPLIVAPAEVAVVERAQVTEHLLFKCDRLAGRQVGRQAKLRWDRLSIRTGIGGLLPLGG